VLCGLAPSGQTVAGTPTCSAAGSVTLQVTEGAAHTATKTYASNIHVGTSLSLVQATASSCSATSPVNIATVTSGNVLVIKGTQNPLSNGLGLGFSDYLSNYFTPLYGSASQLRATATNRPEVLGTWIGFIATGGADKLECHNSAPLLIVQELSNLQQAVDFGLYSNPLAQAAAPARLLLMH